MIDTAIAVFNVCKSYQVFDNQRSRWLHTLWSRHTSGMQEIHALKDINFEIKRGEAVAIIGRNGAGKSTLLEVLTGTLKPTSGSAKVNGRVSALLELGSCFDPEYSGRDNVILNGLLLGLSREEILNRFSEIEEFAEIGTAIDRLVKTYSSGMMMRLAFAVQVLCDPDILIIDEALSVGDFFFQQKCLGYIHGLRAKGVTLIFVSHDMGIVRDLCPRVLYLKNGELIFDGLSADAIQLFFRELGTKEVSLALNKNSDELEILDKDQLDTIKANAVWAGEHAENDIAGGKILAVAFFDKSGEPKTSFKMGETIKISVAYTQHASHITHIAVGLTDKYGRLSTMTGSFQLGLEYKYAQEPDTINCFDLYLDLALEAGNYSVKVILCYATGANIGEILDQSLEIGPIQIVWDYTNNTAPFLGQCGLPARAVFTRLRENNKQVQVLRI